MERIPQETVNHISSYLDYASLQSVLYVSRSFQIAAEQYSGAFRDFVLTEENAERLFQRYEGESGLRRLGYLREVVFKPSFPELGTYNGEIDVAGQNRFRESKDDLETLDKNFTRQIRFLFSTLERLDDIGAKNLHLKIFTPTLQADPSQWGLQRNFVSWRVHLLDSESLPSSECITTFTIERPEPIAYRWDFPPSLRKLDARVLLDLASRFPNLATLRCKTGGDEWRSTYRCRMQEIYRFMLHDWVGPRRDSRHDFGKALDTSVLPTSLHHAYLDFLYPLEEAETIDQRWTVPDLTAPSTYDPFSNSLRLLSRYLRTMHLRVVADSTLFWPSGTTTAPAWPLLEMLHVVFHIATPSGSWYFEAPAGVPGPHQTDIEDQYAAASGEYPPLVDRSRDITFDRKTIDSRLNFDTADFHFRVQPHDETLVPFLAALAKAAAQMPALKSFAVWSPLRFSARDDVDDEAEDYDEDDDEGFDWEEADLSHISRLLEEGSRDMAWGIAYAKPQERGLDKDSEGTEGISESELCKRRIWWRVGGWRPDEELHGLFRRIEEEAFGELVEYWDLEGLGGRGDFLDHGRRCGGD